MPNRLATDLDHILQHTEGLWEELRGQRLFITGGTGFFGCWLLESFAWANDRLHLNANVLVLTRSVEAVRKKVPHLADHPAIQFHVDDVRSFEPPSGTFSHVIHAAAVPTTNVWGKDALMMLETIIEGTCRTLEIAKYCNAKKFLFISSGAVYGTPPATMTRIPEDFHGAPDTLKPQSSYAEGKRMAELLCAVYANSYGIEAKIARCFAFLGPYQPLDAQFAIGNFLRDGLKGRTIQVQGDGTTHRSYLYAADLAIWLWTVLFRGRSCYPYNIGSEYAVTIAELANRVAQSFQPSLGVQIAKPRQPGQIPERYIPSTMRAKSELGLRQFTLLPEAIAKTIRWHEDISAATEILVD